jgi:hypothetical protein
VGHARDTASASKLDDVTTKVVSGAMPARDGST